MPRLLLPFLALTAITHARIPTLGPAHDVNDAVNLSQFVFVPWGGNNLVGIDETKRRLVRCGYDYSHDYLSSQKVVLMENLPAGSQMIAAEVDSHAGPEVILLAGNRCHIWSSGVRTAAGIAPDISFDLPAVQRARSSPAVVADFNGDGIPDLLLPATGHVLFSFATVNAKTVGLPELPAPRITTARPWRNGGPAVIAFQNPYSENPSTTVIEFQGDRTPQTVEVLDGTDFLVDLDGMAPPERIRSESSYSGAVLSRTLSIRNKAGGTWVTAAILPFPAGAPYLDGPATIADFDQNGRQELIYTAASNEISVGPSIVDLWKIGATGGLPGTTVTRSGGYPGRLLGIEPVWLPHLGRFGLAEFRSSSDFTDALGNPTSLPGTGMRTLLRNQPLDNNSPGTWKVSLNEIPLQISTALLDGDHLPDLVISGENGTAFYHTGPYHNPGGGEKTPIWIEHQGNGIEFPDLNGDGMADSLFGTFNSLVAIRTHRNTAGSAIFSDSSTSLLPESLNLPAPNRLLGTSDFDGDGDNDALILQGIDETLAWSPNDGNGSFSKFHPIAQAGREYRIPDYGGVGAYQWIDHRQTLILDADHDGDPDIVTLPSALGNRLALHRNQFGVFTLETFGPTFDQFPGSWNFFTHASDNILLRGKFLSSTDDLQIAVLAPGGDGLSDPAIRTWFLKSSPGNLTVSNPVDLFHAAVAIAADFDSDGIDDFITATGPDTGPLGNIVGSPAIHFHRNRGDGTVDPPLTLATPTGFASTLEVADLNGDGKPDLITASKETGNVDVYIQQGVEALPSYQDWIAGFDLADISPQADPDGDGLVNLLEYSRGSTPGPRRASTPSPIPPPIAPGFTFPRSWQAEAAHARPRQTNGKPLDIGIETSTDLKNWRPVATAPSIDSSPHSPEWEVLRWRFQTAIEDPPLPRFYRFRVSNAEE